MITQTVVADSTAGYAGMVYGHAGDYATAHGTASAFLPITSWPAPYVGQSYASGSFDVFRTFFRFDTNFIGAGNVVYSAYLTLTRTIRVQPGPDYDIQVVKCGSLSNLSTGYAAAFAAGFAGQTDTVWRNTAVAADGLPHDSPALDPTYIDKTGFTWYALRADCDKLQTVPGANTYYLVNIGGPTFATPAYRPTLTVSYGPPLPTAEAVSDTISVSDAVAVVVHIDVAESITVSDSANPNPPEGIVTAYVPVDELSHLTDDAAGGQVRKLKVTPLLINTLHRHAATTDRRHRFGYSEGDK